MLGQDKGCLKQPENQSEFQKSEYDIHHFIRQVPCKIIFEKRNGFEENIYDGAVIDECPDLRGAGAHDKCGDETYIENIGDHAIF